MAPINIKTMASLVINSIRSTVNYLENPENRKKSDSSSFNNIIAMKSQLKILEVFVLCARKLGNDALLRFDDGKVSTLASLLRKIHHALPATPSNWDDKDFESAIGNFNKEIGGWYNTMLVSLPQPTFDAVTELIDCVLENLYSFTAQPLLFEAMIEKITFLRNFIRFATLRSVEPPQLLDNLLAHIQAVAVDTAHTSFMYSFQICDEEEEYDVRPNIPALLQMFKMVDDPQVDETYAEALTSSKLSTQLHSPIPDKDHHPSVIMKDFIDSLLWNLWKRLPIVISTNSDLRLVHEGLRLLRIMLKEQPNKFDKKIGELTRVVICDAGIMIFSLCQRDMEIVVPNSGLLQRINRITQIVNGKDFSFPDLLQRISRIRRRVEGKDLSFPDLLQRIHSAGEQMGGNGLPRTNELGFIDFVLENLLEMTSSKACYGFRSQFRMIHDELSLLRFSLGEIEGVRDERKELAALWNDGVTLAYRVEYLFDQLVFGDFQGSSSTSFDSTVEDILKEAKSINSKIHLAPDIKVKKVSMTPHPVLSQNRAPVADEIVGFDDDITSIIDRLTRGSEQLKVVAIVGMPGMGKTTLATKVFNHPSVTCHFLVRLCCCVSQLFHKKNLLLELLNLLVPDTSIALSEQDLSEKLRKHLKGKKYLIFLDDVWDIEAWDSLKASFPDDSYGSRILVTSRQHHAVLQAMLDEAALSPSKLTEDQSWALMQKKLPLRNEWPLELAELGKQIAANCKGLPLTVVVVAGLLANMEPQCWKIFLESITSVSEANHCMDTLELSYKHLPGHLKQCFLYFGLFPEDHEVSVKKLIRLWIAEGFVLRTESKSFEDVARDYVMDLAGRSLVIVSKRGFNGGVKACRIHDLLHDFCGIKAKDENFFQSLKGGYDEFLCFDEPGYMRRLCVHSERKHFKNLMVFCPRLHSLLFFGQDKEDMLRNHDISFIIPRYSRLRVLGIDDYCLNFWNGIPSEIGLFLQLKYLSVLSGNSDIPASIGNLINLETFILIWSEVSMPDTFWNLQKLRHVDMRGGFRLAFENLEKFPDLCELQSCSLAIIGRGESMERLVRKFPNIRKLRCALVWKFSKDSNENESLVWKSEILDSEDSNESEILDSEDSNESEILDSKDSNVREILDLEDSIESEFLDSEDFNEREILDSEDSNESEREILDSEDSNESESESEILDSEDSNERGSEILDLEDSKKIESGIEILIPNTLWKLESIGLTSRGIISQFKSDLPGNLRKLSLREFGLNQRDVSMIGKLANLEVLKLSSVDFHEDTWEIADGEFSKLRFLELSHSKIVRWTASDDQLPCLEKLVLDWCRCLDEIPDRDCFENMDTIEVIHCCDAVNKFFQGIQDGQRALGNLLPNIRISRLQVILPPRLPGQIKFRKYG